MMNIYFELIKTMKKLFLLMCLSLSSVFAFSQWTSQTSGTTEYLQSVYFTDADTGYAVGTGRTILKTNNGGTNWTVKLSGGGAIILTSVYFSDADTGYVVGYDYMSSYLIILKTTNGGTNWTSKSSSRAFGDDLQSVYFTDLNTGYAVGSNGIILKTSNGGTNWTSQTSGTTNDLYSVYFTDVNTGYAVGNGIIIKTTNGGTNWIAQTSGGETSVLTSVYFTDSNTGYAVGSGGTILKTNNGGVTYIEETESLEPTFSIYPNPTTGKYNITVPDEFVNEKNLTLTIFDNSGKLIQQKKLEMSEGKIKLDLEQEAKGIYNVTLSNGKKVYAGKIVFG